MTSLKEDLNINTTLKYHSTNQFRQVVKTIKHNAAFNGWVDGEAVFDYNKSAPTVKYIGTVKLHGTNGSIVLNEQGIISFHSKSKLCGYVDTDDSFNLNSDNAEFAQSMYRRLDAVKEVLENAKTLSKELYDKVIYPIKVSGEWAGMGIQKGVGISFLPKKSFFIFGVKFGETNQKLKRGWVQVSYTQNLSSKETQESGIYAITDFPVFEVDIDFNSPEFIQNTLVKYTEQVEKCCPVSEVLKTTNTSGEKELLGEGIVWTPDDADLCWDTGTWFKTKGQKHSVSKVKSVAAVDTEKLNSIQEFVEYAVTDNRLEQGLIEVGLDQKLVGKFIGWVNSDINKEESDTLESNNLTMKDVGKYVSNKARVFYLEKLNTF